MPGKFWGRRLEDMRSDPVTQHEQDTISSQSTHQLKRPEKWTLGILNDKETEEVPGTVLLLTSNRNEPLGIKYHERRDSTSSMPSQRPDHARDILEPEKKTADGRILLNPQPDDSVNDPLNWPAWRRDVALISLGLYCMVGGGTTPILAAAYHDVVDSLHVTYEDVARTTGLYMMGLGVGSVIFSPTAILFGKRPVYLASAILFIVTSIWCAASPNYASLATARVFQGIAVSPVECLPSATIAEIFFLHERAFRIGIYTLLLLGGKNLVPLISAVIVQSLSWRWIFWILALVIGFCWLLLFFFVPETFWDRTPRPKMRHQRESRLSLTLSHRSSRQDKTYHDPTSTEMVMSPRQKRLHDQNIHARFEEPDYFGHNIPNGSSSATLRVEQGQTSLGEPSIKQPDPPPSSDDWDPSKFVGVVASLPQAPQQTSGRKEKPGGLKLPVNSLRQPPASQGIYDRDEPVPHLHNLNSPFYEGLEKTDDYFTAVPEQVKSPVDLESQSGPTQPPARASSALSSSIPDAVTEDSAETDVDPPRLMRYTTNLRHAPPQPYVNTLKVWNGRLSQASWLRVALRPFILFCYPSVLWSSMIYSLSVGWLIVMSESVGYAYQSQSTYDFSALSTGLVYISPFIGGILGTCVAGKVSDVVVRYMARRNGGVYEPEFRLVMAIPIAISTTIGLMGFGWSVQVGDAWIVPTVFFGVISFGCFIGSTTAITFCVDSYRQYAGEALVTLNFSKNIFHGLVFSLFFARWLQADGGKTVFLAIGGIQLGCCLLTIPMYIYGKRARMWTVRKRFMEKF